MADTDFLHFLVDETLELQRSGNDLSSIEAKLNDYKLSFLKGEYIPQTHVLRFKAHFGVLDIPVNWSVFDLSHTHTDTVLSENTDADLLFKVLKKAWNPEFSQMLITNADGFCYLVGLKPGDEHHIRDLLSSQEWLKVA